MTQKEFMFKIGDKVMYSVSYLIRNELQYSMKDVLSIFTVDGYDTCYGCKDVRLKTENGYYIYLNDVDLEKYK